MISVRGASMMISDRLPANSAVTLKVDDMPGGEGAALVDKFNSGGRCEVRFDASHLSKGEYCYSVQAGEYRAGKKKIVMK